MKQYLIYTLSLCLTAAVCSAQKSAAQWATENAATLSQITAPALADILKKGQPALDELFAKIKTNGESDPVASVTIGALSEYVMTASSKERAFYAQALLTAAQKAQAADVTCFYLNQLRWCGLPKQEKAILAFTKSNDTSIAQLATIVAYAVVDDRATKRPIVAKTPCGVFNNEMAACKPKKRTPRLMAAFDGTDTQCAGTALVWLNAADNAEKTAIWAEKLATTKCPVRAIMLMDALAMRGDRDAVPSLCARINDSTDSVAQSAMANLLKLDANRFALCMAEHFATNTPARIAQFRLVARSAATKSLVPPLVKGYDTFSVSGKKAALELFRDRRVTEALKLGIQAVNDPELAPAGLRLLREIGTVTEIPTVLPLLQKAATTEEAQLTYAAIARRDTTRAAQTALSQALANSAPEEKSAFLETAARIGGDAFLKQVELCAKSAHPQESIAAIRALGNWVDAQALPALMASAITAKDSKGQTLALRAITQKLSAKGADKECARKVWQTIRTQPGNEENKLKIDDMLK